MDDDIMDLFEGIENFPNPKVVKPKLKIVEQPADQVKFRYPKEINKTSFKIKGSNQNTFPKVKILNCPHMVRVQVSLVSSKGDITNKICLYDARSKNHSPGQPSLHFHDGICSCYSNPSIDNNHDIQFDGLGVELIRCDDTMLSLRKDKKLSLAQTKYVNRPIPQPLLDIYFSDLELQRIDKEVSMECQDCLNDRLSLKFSTSIKDGNTWTNVIEDVYSSKFTNSKSSMLSIPDVVTYAPTTCSPVEETKLIIILKNKINKDDMAIYIRDSYNPTIKIEGRIIEVHHKVCLECGIPPNHLFMESSIEFTIVNKQKSYGEHVWNRLFYLSDEFAIRKRKKNTNSVSERTSTSSNSNLSIDNHPQSTDIKSILRKTILAKRTDLRISSPDIVSDSCPLLTSSIQQPPSEFTVDASKEKSDGLSELLDGSGQFYSDILSEKESRNGVAHTGDSDFHLNNSLKMSSADSLESIFQTLLIKQLYTLLQHDFYGDGSLHNVLLKNNLYSAQYLLSVVTNFAPDALIQTNWSGQTPLHILAAAKMDDNEEAAIHLAESFVSICPNMVILQDDKLRNPIHYAIIHGKKRLCQILLEAVVSLVDSASSINDVDCELLAPLHYAVIGDQCDLVKQLILSGADINLSSGRNKRTPLHLAAIYKCQEIALLLLENDNVDINALEINGASALGLAEEKHFKDLVQCLEVKQAVKCYSYEELIDDLDEDIEMIRERLTHNSLYSTGGCSKRNGESIVNILKSSFNQEEFFQFVRALCHSSDEKETDEIIDTVRCSDETCKWEALEDICADKLSDNSLKIFLPYFLRNDLKRNDIYNTLFLK